MVAREDEEWLEYEGEDESDGVDLGNSAWDIVENSFTPDQY